MAHRMASFNEGPLSALKPTFECPSDGVNERQKVAEPGPALGPTAPLSFKMRTA
ncbi:hypothetical protein AWB69_01109 [Caballeronia udeis]|uniref:Uncharacterized protein n=1 Tax=Caballeronia udeis TaxID=1232866 RepID=A0A158FG86_9BURK|nr:hypothetical protein AWB69_01109 [Caballeronia udeis]